jgi:deoxyribodipyrimidine photo-lyase
MNQKFQNRVRHLNSNTLNNSGEYVLYWMQINRRFDYNYALEYAVALANSVNKPLLIYEGLSASYPWASDRFHTYLLQGMEENQVFANKDELNYVNYVEIQKNEGKGLVYELCNKAVALVTDDYPVFIIRQHNEKVSAKISIPYIVVDSNGILPLQTTVKAPFTAFHFRKILQKNFAEAYHLFPEEKPLHQLINREKIELEESFVSRYPQVDFSQHTVESVVKACAIDHSVAPIQEKGTREHALLRYNEFINKKLSLYNSERNNPDSYGSSKMSGYLHFGKISVHEMVKMVIDKTGKEWNPHLLTYKNGQSGSFYHLPDYAEAFLDELITWREVGYHFAHHVDNYDQFESLPDWALTTLKEHEQDKREVIYTLDQFEKAKTHDALWNAAQRELVKEGRIHNYLRMLWGKKILEWTESPRKALEVMIELNNKYAIDGRDPNSYSGIFWVLGRFDRAWAERPVFGKIRYMSSEQTAKKIQLKTYLKRYSGIQK